jgi:hypothetical protein
MPNPIHTLNYYDNPDFTESVIQHYGSAAIRCFVSGENPKMALATLMPFKIADSYYLADELYYVFSCQNPALVLQHIQQIAVKLDEFHRGGNHPETLAGDQAGFEMLIHAVVHAVAKNYPKMDFKDLKFPHASFFENYDMDNPNSSQGDFFRRMSRILREEPELRVLPGANQKNQVSTQPRTDNKKTDPLEAENDQEVGQHAGFDAKFLLDNFEIDVDDSEENEILPFEKAFESFQIEFKNRLNAATLDICKYLKANKNDAACIFALQVFAKLLLLNAKQGHDIFGPALLSLKEVITHFEPQSAASAAALSCLFDRLFQYPELQESFFLRHKSIEKTAQLRVSERSNPFYGLVGFFGVLSALGGAGTAAALVFMVLLTVTPFSPLLLLFIAAPVLGVGLFGLGAAFIWNKVTGFLSKAALRESQASHCLTLSDSVHNEFTKDKYNDLAINSLQAWLDAYGISIENAEDLLNVFRQYPDLVNSLDVARDISVFENMYDDFLHNYEKLCELNQLIPNKYNAVFKTLFDTTEKLLAIQPGENSTHLLRVLSCEPDYFKRLIANGKDFFNLLTNCSEAGKSGMTSIIRVILSDKQYFSQLLKGSSGTKCYLEAFCGHFPTQATDIRKIAEKIANKAEKKEEEEKERTAHHRPFDSTQSHTPMSDVLPVVFGKNTFTGNDNGSDNDNDSDNDDSPSNTL